MSHLGPAPSLLSSSSSFRDADAQARFRGRWVFVFDCAVFRVPLEDYLSEDASLTVLKQHMQHIRQAIYELLIRLKAKQNRNYGDTQWEPKPVYVTSHLGCHCAVVNASYLDFLLPATPARVPSDLCSLSCAMCFASVLYLSRRVSISCQ